jgi:hypothetical protein
MKKQRSSAIPWFQNGPPMKPAIDEKALNRKPEKLRMVASWYCRKLKAKARRRI